MKNFSGVVVVAGLIAASASHAADIARPVYKAPVVAPVYNWSGFYVGGNLGYGWGHETGGLWRSYTDPGTVGFVDYFGIGGNVLPGTKPAGILGGGQIGFNWQTASFVFGVIADLQAAGLNDSNAAQFAAPGGAAHTIQTKDTSIDWFGTVRGRAGFAADNWFFYGTGGLAYGKAKTSTSFACDNCTDPFLIAGTSSPTKTGWAAGGGVEIGLSPNWTIGVEYLRVDLGSDTIVALVSGGVPAAGVTLNAESRYSIDIVRGSINYKFDYGKAPVVAKY